MVNDKVNALLVCGPRGVGKSVVAFEIFLRLVNSGVKAGYVDLAQVGFRGPGPADHAFTSRNVAALWQVYRAEGAERLILSGNVATDAGLRHYAAALPGVPLTVCRLAAGPEQLRTRLHARAAGQGPALPGESLRDLPPAELDHLATRAAAEATALDRAALGDFRVDTDDRTVESVADEIRALSAVIGSG